VMQVIRSNERVAVSLTAALCIWLTGRREQCKLYPPMCAMTQEYDPRRRDVGAKGVEQGVEY
jgi:hypothetical protein